MEIRVDIKQIRSICTVFPLNAAVFVVLLSFVSTSALAQSADLPDSIRFEHINIETGLASSQVNAITQDSEGFMWFATTQGLNRFDGYEYQWFGKNPNDEQRDTGRNRILSLYDEGDDEGDTLWIGTDYLIRYSTVDNTLTRYMVSNGTGINVITSDGNGHLLLGGHQLGLRFFDIELGEVVGTYDFEPEGGGGKINTIIDIAVAEDGMIWTATPSGVYMFNPKTRQFSQPAVLLGLTGHISSIEIDAFQRVWIGSWDGLYLYDYNNGRLNSFTQEEVGFSKVHSLLVDSNDRVWVGSDKNGVATYDPQTNKFIHHKADDTHPYEIGSGSVFEIYEDDVESIWFAVHGYGLYRYNPNAQLFDLYLAEPTKSDGLGHQQIGPIFVDSKKTAWIGTEGGLFALQRESDRFNGYRKQNGLGNNGVLGLAEAADETLWIGMWDGGLNQFDPKTGQFRHWTTENGLNTNNVFTLLVDSQNRLWISTWDHGVQLLDLETEQFIEPFPAHKERGESSSEDGLQNISIMAILEASDGTMWFGGYGGLEQYNPRTGLFRHFWTDDSRPARDQISSNTIFVLHEDSNGIVWVGTDSGLNRIDPITGVISTYTVSDGLPDNVIVGILEDEEGDLWLSTKRGVSLFRREKGKTGSFLKFQNFSMNTGLQGEEFNRFSYGQGEGLMYFGGTNGFNRFDPIKLKQTSQADSPRVELTDLLLAGEPVYPNTSSQSVLAQTINTAEKITLSAHDDMFSIKFAALEYTRPGQVQYQYKLEKHHSHWVKRSSDERIATYTNIRPGSYTFRVQAFSADGSPSANEASVEIYVAPHWWETVWFNVVLAGSIMLFLIVGSRIYQRTTKDKLEIGQKEREATIYRQKNNELQRMNKKLMSLNEQKDDMLGIVAHDLRNPLAVMQLNLEMLLKYHDKLSSEKQKKKLRQVEQMVRTTHEMADRLLTEGQEKGITAEIEPIYVAPILQELYQQYESKAAQKQIRLVQKWDTHRQVGVAADSTMLRQVIDNLLSNAIKYSYPDSLVTVCVEQVENVVNIIVQDEGQGMTAEDLEHVFGRYAKLSARPTQGEQSVGMGLYNVKTLVESMNGMVTVVSAGRDMGCTFTVKLPRATVANAPTPAVVPTFRPAKRPERRNQ